MRFDWLFGADNSVSKTNRFPRRRKPAEFWSGTDRPTEVLERRTLPTGSGLLGGLLNLPPVGTSDTYSVLQDTILNSPTSVLANDTDPNPGDSLNAILLIPPLHGTLNLLPTGLFTYTPTSGFSGTDLFTYIPNDGTLSGLIPVISTIEVLPLVNHVPVAFNDTFTLPENTILDLSLGTFLTGILANDTDADLVPLTASLVSTTQHGTLLLLPTGTFIYTPDPNFTGTDTFTYRASDVLSVSNVATVTFNVTAVNDPPTAVNDTYHLNENSILNISLDPLLQGVLANDSDPDSLVLTASIVTSVQHGTLTFLPTGNFIYVPDLNFSGTDSFTYRASDLLSSSNVATVTLNVTHVNRAPVSNNDTYDLLQNITLDVSLGSLLSGVLANDTDSDSLLLTASLVTSTQHGSLTFLPTGHFVYVPNLNFSGTDSFTYQASDGLSMGNVATVTLNVAHVNQAPVANNDSYNLAQNLALEVSIESLLSGVLANDTDSDSAALTATLVSTTQHGTLTFLPTGHFIYVPDLNFFGTDTFTYRASDLLLNSNLATVILNVAHVNQAPVANNDTFALSQNVPLDLSLASITSGVLANDTDVDGDTLTASIVTSPQHGTLTFLPIGTFIYVPDLNFSGIDSFSYRASDLASFSNVATVTLNVAHVNQAPVAISDSFSVAVNATLSVNAQLGLLSNDSDIDSVSLNAQLAVAPLHGSVTVGLNGSFVYTPDQGFTGIDVFSYFATDGLLNSAHATVTITVTGSSNIPPVATNDGYGGVEDLPLTVLAANGLLTNDRDGNNDPLTATVVLGPSHGNLSLSTDGSFTYTPHTNFFGTDSFTYRAGDGLALSNVATVTLTIGSVNDAPMAQNDTYFTTKNSGLSVSGVNSVLVNDSDVDSGTLTASIASLPTNGNLTFNADGTFTYSPLSGFSGTDSFTYRASDGLLSSNLTTVTINVAAPANSPPIANDDEFSTSEDVPLQISAASGILSNDTDVDGNSLTAQVVAGPIHGTLTLAPNGSLVYIPHRDYHGTDYFTYQTNDGSTNGNVATVSLTISSINDTGVAVADSYSAIRGATLLVDAANGVLANDSDVDNDLLTAQLETTTSNGTLTFNADGSFTYRPNPGFTGSDSFSYRVDDGVSLGAPSTVSLSVIVGANFSPIANTDSYAVTEDTPLTVLFETGVLSNDTDANDDPLIALLVSPPVQGSITLNADGSFTYTPRANYSGPDSFSYRASDTISQSVIATVSLNVLAVNDAPIGANDRYTVAGNTVLVVTADNGVLTNDSDLDSLTLTAAPIQLPLHGSFSLSSDGSFTYTPDLGFTGTDVFTYRVSDGESESAATIVTLTVTAEANAPPQATTDQYFLGEDTSLTVSPLSGLLANDSDTDLDHLTAIVLSPPAHGIVVVASDGSFVYTPDANYAGLDSFTYQANDGVANSNVATVTLTIAGTNDAPVAQVDHYNTTFNTPLTVSAANGVLTNDSDVDNSTLSATVSQLPLHGQLTFNSNGSFSYQPNAGYSGNDSFSYRASDGSASTLPATVTISIAAPVNSAPVAVNDSFSLAEDSVFTTSTTNGLLVNDSDADGNTLNAFLVSQPAHGAVTLANNGTFVYTPHLNYNGADSFTYQINDGTANSNIATALLTVTAVNDGPVAKNDSYTVVQNRVLTVTTANGILTNDLDVDSANLTISLILSTPNGTLLLNPNGSFTYTPPAGFTGVDTFTYRISDGVLSSDLATASIFVVAPTNSPPSVANDAYQLTEDSILTVTGANGLLVNDSDADSNPLSVTLVSSVRFGVLVLTPDGTFTYTPNVNFFGTDSFTYQAHDGLATSAIATVVLTINGVNDAPVAVDDSYTMLANQSLTVTTNNGVLANDIDAENSSLTASVVNNPLNGTLTLNASGSFTYTPRAGFVGVDSFLYRDSDGALNSNSIMVTISVVTPPNSAPTAANDTYQLNEDSTLTITAGAGVLVNDVDSNGDPLTARIVSRPLHGTVELGQNGSFVYTPYANYNGTDSFTYQANDGAANSGVATVSLTINPVNDAPVAVGESYSINEDAILTVGVSGGLLENDADNDGSALQSVLVTPPLHGTLVLNSNGSFSYTPNANYHGNDSFVYRATDGVLNSANVTATIQVNSVNDLPVTSNDAYFVNEDLPLTIPAGSGVLSNDFDPDGDLLSVRLISQPSHGLVVLSSDGSLTYSPYLNYNGSDSFTYQASDSTGNGAVTTVSITIASINDSPASVSDNYSINEDTVLSIPASAGVLSNDSDTDGQSLTAQLITPPLHGLVTLATNGSFAYTPSSNYSGPDSFTYQASDGFTNGPVTTVWLAVSSTNDIPIAQSDSYMTAEDTPLLITKVAGVLGNDTDADGDPLRAVLISGALHGTLTLGSDGSLNYVPASGFHGTDTFTYRVTDGSASSVTATVTITVTSVNVAPVALNDTYTTTKGTTLNVVSALGVLANDTDSDQDPLSAILVTPPQHGTAVLGTDGSLSYTPAAGYAGSDTLTYRAKDGTLSGNLATVTITVNNSTESLIVTTSPGKHSVKGRRRIVVDPASSVTIPNGNQLKNGHLIVTIQSGVGSNDSLSYRHGGANQGRINSKRNQIRVGRVVVGTFSGGLHGTPLDILFNSEASVERVRRVMQNLTFRGTPGSAGHRVIAFQVQDSQGNVSNIATKQIDLN